MWDYVIIVFQSLREFDAYYFLGQILVCKYKMQKQN